MTPKKNLGIWMDHATAHLMEFTNGVDDITTLVSPFTHEAKQASFENSEHVMHNKEQQQQSAWYKKLGEAIRNYDEVLLFGPTDAKQELFNILRADHRFEKVSIEVKQADKMTENQQHAFVKEHFAKH